MLEMEYDKCVYTFTEILTSHAVALYRVQWVSGSKIRLLHEYDVCSTYLVGDLGKYETRNLCHVALKFGFYLQIVVLNAKK